MNQNEFHAEYMRIEHQIRLIKNNTGKIPTELISLSCQSVCLSICGSLEHCLKLIFVEYAKRKSGNKFNSAIAKLCNSFQNPNTRKILDLVKLFDEEFGRELEALWSKDNESEKSYLDNLVSDRHSIAHRKRPHVNVTLKKLDDYFKAYKALLTRIRDHFLNNTAAAR